LISILLDARNSLGRDIRVAAMIVTISNKLNPGFNLVSPGETASFTRR
jgi:hypothetical protein